jgi:hypothetical protein
MGNFLGTKNFSPEYVNLIYNNIIELEKIDEEYKGGKLDFTHKTELHIIQLYKPFYNLRGDPLVIMNERTSGYYLFKKILSIFIISYNEHNKTNIDVDEYVKKTYKNLKSTLEYYV